MLPTTSSSSSPSSTTSTSTKTNHVDIDVLSTHIESLRQRMSPIMKSPTPTNGEKPSPRHLPSKVELLFRDFQETSMEIFSQFKCLTISTSCCFEFKHSIHTNQRRSDQVQRTSLINPKTIFSFSELTRAKYQAIIQNSGLFYIDGQVEKKIARSKINSSFQHKHIEQKEIVKEYLLGAGSCGEVFRMEHQPSKTLLAVKVCHMVILHSRFACVCFFCFRVQSGHASVSFGRGK